jgi:hypothetical protein
LYDRFSRTRRLISRMPGTTNATVAPYQAAHACGDRMPSSMCLLFISLYQAGDARLNHESSR